MAYSVKIFEHYYATSLNAPSDWYIGQEDYPDQPPTAYATQEEAQVVADDWNSKIQRGDYWLSEDEYARPEASVVSAK
jgi:hypothetical protein